MSYDRYHEYLKSQYSNDETVIEDEVALVHKIVPWYVDYVNYLTDKVLHPDMTYQHKKTLFYDLIFFIWTNHSFPKEEPVAFSTVAFLRRKYKAL